jgi:glycerol-3-phosphate dehydrogenase (NAD(P)+)
MTHVMAVIGGGRLARAIGQILGRRIEVRIWARSETQRSEVAAEVPDVSVEAELGKAVGGATLVFLAVPATSMLEVAERYGDHAKGDHLVLTASRGVGPGFRLPHEMIRAKTCVRKIAALGGPLHMRELALGRPLSAVLASRYSEPIEAVRAVVKGGPVTIHASRDITGVEVAGAISNVSALAAGMADALDLGETARGVLLTHGLIDARRLGVARGASPDTFAGLAGVGDLIPRKVTSTERHAQVAERAIRAGSFETALREPGGALEGVTTAKEAAAAAKALGLELPLVFAVGDILSGADPRARLEAVLSRPIDL